MPISTLIFSKDRPAQLELLLRTMWTFRKDYKESKHVVIYKASTEEYRIGYDKAKAFYTTIDFIPEDNFKLNVLNSGVFDEKYLMFLVDDNVFLRPFYGEDNHGMQRLKDDESLCCVSLRVHPNISHCYAYDSSVTSPRMRSGVWTWKNASGDYGYPMSLDGHIFRTADILPLLRDLQYENPNQLEGELSGHPPDRSLMTGVNKPIVVGVPWNKVQTENDNRNAGLSYADINQEFLEGKTIQFDSFVDLEPNAVHITPELIMR